MAVTFNAAGAVKSNAGSGDMTTVALPAGFAADDIHVLVVASSDNVAVTATGFTSKLATNSSTNCRLSVLWRRAVAGDSTFTVTHTAGNGALCRVFGYRGCVTSGDPFEDAQIQANTGTLTITAPNLTLATTAGNMILFCAAVGTAGTSNTFAVASYSGTDPAFTERQDSSNVSGSNHAHLVEADGVRTAASAPGSRTATITTAYSAATVNNVGALLALKDASAGGGGTTVKNLAALGVG